MTQSRSAAAEAPGLLQNELVQVRMQRVERRVRWLWSSAVLSMLLLGLGVASLDFPRLLTQAVPSASFYLAQSLRGLVAIVLLFNVYTVYQQLQIREIQRRLTDQISALSKIEVRTEEVYKMAVLDPLTGLYNRRSGGQRLVEEMSRAERHGRALMILLFDIDGLKQINDSFGHRAGDQLIRHFAERLQRAIRGSDLAVRLGGDEFLAVLPECGVEEVERLLERLGGMQINLDGQRVPFNFSIGWSAYIPGELPEGLLERADAALYVNKRSGKSSTQTFD